MQQRGTAAGRAGLRRWCGVARRAEARGRAGPMRTGPPAADASRREARRRPRRGQSVKPDATPDRTTVPPSQHQRQRPHQPHFNRFPRTTFAPPFPDPREPNDHTHVHPGLRQRLCPEQLVGGATQQFASSAVQEASISTDQISSKRHEPDDATAAGGDDEDLPAPSRCTAASP